MSLPIFYLCSGILRWTNRLTSGCIIMWTRKNQRPPAHDKSYTNVLKPSLSPNNPLFSSSSSYSSKFIIVEVLFSLGSWTYHISFFFCTDGSNVITIDQRVSKLVSGMTPGSGGILTNLSLDICCISAISSSDWFNYWACLTSLGPVGSIITSCTNGSTSLNLRTCFVW